MPPGSDREARADAALAPVAEGLAALLSGIDPVASRTEPLRAAEGRILAAAIRPPGPVPPAALALRDGYAVASEAVVGASAYSPVLLPALPLVRAGGMLPSGTDCVLPPDAACRAAAGLVEVTASLPPGDGVRRVGEDAAAGAPLRHAGEVMRAIDVAAAAAAGLRACTVREPRVRVLSAASKPDAVTDLLQRMAVLGGAQVVHQQVWEPTRQNAIVGAPPADLILIAGDMPLAREILARNGAAVAGGLALRPGEGAVCGRIGAAPVVIVPRRLDAALALALVVVRPCLEHLSGAHPPPATQRRPLTRKISSALGLTEVVLLAETAAGFAPLAIGDLPLAAIGRADAWLAVPPESEGYPAGELVAAQRL